MAEKQVAKREKLENLEILEKKKKQRKDEREEVETQNCFECDKSSNEKPSNQVAIETEKKTFN